MIKNLKIMFSPLNGKQKKLLKELITYNMTENTYKQYITEIKNNENDSKELSKMKLIRNIILSREIHNRNGVVFYQFGNLEVHVNTDLKLIYKLKNCKGRYSCNLDYKKKEWLEEFLKLNN